MIRPCNALVLCFSMLVGACTPRASVPESLPAAGKDPCRGYQPFTAALAVATIACRGGLQPTDFVVQDGQLRRAFDACAGENDGQRTEAALLRIDRMLSIQARSKELLTAGAADARVCIAHVYQQAADRLRAAGVTCPTWKLDRVVGVPTKASVQALVQARRAAGEPGERLVSLAHAAESFELYTAAFPDNAKPQKCGSAESCAEACASVFPGFVEARYGELIVGDIVWWVHTDDFGFGPGSPLHWSNGYIHDMANADPPAMYGAYERGFLGTDPADIRANAERCTMVTSLPTPPIGVMLPDRLNFPRAMWLSRCMPMP